ncbi:MAG: DEAD/DEAH box helicase [Anaerolineae bacterium]|nr:DEAD/DEAH box helicase [Anaerolineae bacterium]
MTVSFADLGLLPVLVDTVTELGYVEPTPIQSDAIPPLLAGRDVMGQAQTGTGKTAAFTLPMLQHLESEGLQTLILAPTRELAIQTAEAVYRYGNQLGVRVLPVYGGAPYSRQKRRLERGVHVVVGTPGRTLDLVKQGALDLSDVRYVVLDEADEMLKMGFIDDVEAILAATDADSRQTTLFSATLPDSIRRLANTYMHDPVHIAIEANEITVENINQRYYVVEERDKVAAISRLLEVENLHNTLIFARTKVGARELAETLLARGYPVDTIHGDLPQTERERILGRFRRGTLTMLVATDVVARGVDIPDVSHVINFDIPQLGIEYVHRIGRTGRAGRGGDAITLITPRQRHHLRQIEDYTRKRMTKCKLPTREDVLARREQDFRDIITAQINEDASDAEYKLLGDLMDLGYRAEWVAAAAIKLLRANEEQRPLEDIRDPYERPERDDRTNRRDRKDNRKSKSRNGHEYDEKSRNGKSRNSSNGKSHKGGNSHEDGMVRLYMDIGRGEGIKPGDVVYGVASQSGIPGKVIGAIHIQQHETYFDVPENHVDSVLRALGRGKIKGRSMTVVPAEGVFEPA